MTDNTPKSDYLKEIPACEILAKIEKGEPVEYDQIIIDGALNLSELVLPRNDFELFCIMSKIKITNSIITSAIDFNNAIILLYFPTFEQIYNILLLNQAITFL